MKYLFSWLAHNNDFQDGNVNENGPTVTFHRQYFTHDCHFILSSAEKEDLRLELLVNKLVNLFPDRRDKIVPLYMSIQDVVSLEEVKPRVESLLLGYREDELDIFFSPGTSIMQLSWYICHTTLGLNTRLLQTRSAKFSRDKTKVELSEIRVEHSSTPVTAVIKSQLSDVRSRGKEKILYTPSIEPVYAKAFKIAQTDKVTTLILGASGTGKENLARYIHDQSVRNVNPFIAVNCSAMGDSLLESRLFGYKKGAFTGAEKDTLGLLEEADGGTIFLDEIGDISPYMQQLLLRVLQEQEIMPVGGKMRRINLRFIAATNKDLKRMCSEEKFRWDLYYRLSVAELELPTLFERGASEKRALIDHFLSLKKKQFRKPKALTLSPEAYKTIMEYSFPGNIRELENFIESLYVFNDDTIGVGELPSHIRKVSPAFSFHWKEAEKIHIQKVLEHFKGNKRRSCRALGFGSINTLMKKVEEYGLG
jgi:transcriptional regulator with PAS, ATPase and Fis domain